MFTASQLIAHAFGDYVLQSHWMATEKTKRSLAALAHVATYGLPFLFLRPSWLALFVIVSTHFVIDRWRLARYVCWLKNFIGPRRLCLLDAERYVSLNIHQVHERWLRNYHWDECSATGFAPDTPPFLAVWLLIIVDNLMHVAINGLALAYL